MTQRVKIDSFSGDFRFLSNFWPCLGSSTETLYQAAKAASDEDRAYVMASKNAGEAKKRGQTIKMRKDWDHARIGVMRELTRRKYTEHADLGEALLATGDAELIEGNYWGDKFWGVCDGEGQNWLGRILMEVRDELARTPKRS